MNDLANYYREKLYPLQDGILNIVRRLNLPFYLTGGTALSRHYLHHRYSDDLDLFVNNDQQFPMYVDQVFETLEREHTKSGFTIDHAKKFKKESFAQIFVMRGEGIRLKIDVVNDISTHFGEFALSPTLGRIDSWRNILSNKIAALYRFEPKDIVDLWCIAKRYHFSWIEVFQEAMQKELGVDSLAAADILRGMPLEHLHSIKWIEPVDSAVFAQEIAIIANDIIFGSENTLAM